MTISVNTTYELGFLAEVSYGHFDVLENYTDEELKDLLKGTLEIEKDGKKIKYDHLSFSETQIADFIANYEIVSHLPDTTADFSATVFRRKNPQNGEPEYVFSCRGTAGVGDYITDAGDLVANGAAWDQIVDMYNYWQRLITPEGQPCQKAFFNEAAFYRDNPNWNSVIPDVKRIEYLSVVEDSNVTGLGLIPIGTKVDVSGHSLGGHLAAGFSRLFPEQTNNVFTINGAGYGFQQTTVDMLFQRLDEVAGKFCSVVFSFISVAYALSKPTHLTHYGVLNKLVF